MRAVRVRLVAWLVLMGMAVAGCSPFGEEPDRTADLDRIAAEGRARPGVNEVELGPYRRGNKVDGPSRFEAKINFEPTATPADFCTFPAWFFDQATGVGFIEEMVGLELERPPARTVGSTAWWITSIGGYFSPPYDRAVVDLICRAAGEAAGTVGVITVFQVPRRHNEDPPHDIIVSLRDKSDHRRVVAHLRRAVAGYDAIRWRFDG